jgi:flagellar hook-associated protein 2
MSGIQISGINSQLDTNEIVEALLTYDHQNVTLLEYNQVVKTNEISTYQAINAKLLAFQAQARLLAKTDSFSATQISVSNDSYLSAAASEGIGLGNYSVNVEALAQNQQLASQGFDSIDSAVLGSGTVTLQVGDASATTLTINASNNSLEGLKEAINASNAGVTASIINDGSSKNAYRLLLSADKTGAGNTISFIAELNGAQIPDFSSVAFDEVELLSFSSSATSTPTVGAGAAYSGSENKTYTFTVQGSGTQTVGSGDISIDWTDGTESGTIVVSAAATEIAVIDGSFDEGLTLQFAAGDLVAGDTFQVQTFATVLQEAQDARVSIGSTSGGGSPITVTSTSNQVDNLITGLSLNLKQVTEDGPVVISVGRDVDKVDGLVRSFVDSFNAILEAIDAQFEYDPEEDDEAGLLSGDRTLMMIQTTLRSRTITNVAGLEGDYRMLADLGIRFGSDGRLSIADSVKLRTAISDDLDEVIRVFATSGESSHGKISFLAAAADTVESPDGYEVKITQAATRGRRRGDVIADPSITPLVIDESNKNFKLMVNGINSGNMILDKGTYNSFAELAAELQEKIDADEKIGRLGVEVSFTDVGEEGYLQIFSGNYGESSEVVLGSGIQDTVFDILGLSTGTSYKGQDVDGTINGEAASGIGRYLTGDADNANTAGLRLYVELTDSDLLTFDSATISITKGVAAKVADYVDSVTASDNGTISRQTTALQNQIEDLEEQIAEMEERIELKRQRLLQRFLEMETLLGELNSQSAYLETQLANLNQNWGNNSSGGN